MHDRLHRLVAAVMTGLLVAAALAVPAHADSPKPDKVRKAEPRRVVEYRPNRPFTHDTDLLSTSGYAAWMIDELLGATTPLPRLGAAFTRAERETGINARYLVAHAILETGWGTSWIAQRKHNLFGHHAYDRDPLRYATRFPTFTAGIAAVTEEIRASYLSPGGRWWRGFPTLVGVNRFYATDVRWADKVAVLANVIDSVIVTLRERGLHFGWLRLAKPVPGSPVAASSSIVVEVPWTSRTLGLPAAIRFAVRWTPVALAEGGPSPVPSPDVAWTQVGKGARAGHSVRLTVATPAEPGSWQLQIEARDSDGFPLPATDSPPIRPLALRVAAPVEATISTGLDDGPGVADARGVLPAAFGATPVDPARPGGLVATVRNIGRTTIPAVGQDGTSTVLEAWSLPLAADLDTVLLGGAPLAADLPPGGQITLHLPRPAEPAVVVIRFAGNSAAIGRSVPAVAIFNASAAGGATLTQLRVPDLRDGSLPKAAPIAASPPIAASAPIAAWPVPSWRPPTASILQSDAVGEVAIGLQPAAVSTGLDQLVGLPAAAPSILVRTISTLPVGPVDPTVAILSWPGEPTAHPPMTPSVTGVPAGIRLVVVALVPDGSWVADPTTVRLAWVPVADAGTERHPL